MSARSASNASTSIPFRLIAAIRPSHSWRDSIELFNRKERQARESGMPSTLSASVFRPGILAQSAYCGWKDATQFDEVILPCGIDHIAPPLLMQLRPNGIIR